MNSSSLYAIIAALALPACSTMPGSALSPPLAAAFSTTTPAYDDAVDSAEEIRTALEDEPDVVCTREQRTGSRLTHTVCRTRAQIESEHRRARQFLSSFTHSGPNYASFGDPY